MSTSPTWLLELTIGGREFRYATRDVTVTDSRGRALLYRAGLGDFEMQLDGTEESQGLQIFDPSVDWAALAAAGENLERTSAVLRFWEPGEALEAALVVMAGQAGEPEYGEPGAPDQLTVTLAVGTLVDRTWPSPQATINLTTWDRDFSTQAYDDQVEGAFYPTVFGYPGSGDGEVDPPVPCMPALLAQWIPGAVADSYLLIGQGALHCAGGEVYVRDTTGRNDLGFEWDQEYLTVNTTEDNLGQTVTRVVVPVTDGGVDAILGNEYYVGFSRVTGKGGGMLLPDGSGPLQTATDVALFCLRNSGRAVDLEAQEAERVHLDRFLIDGFLNQEVQLVPWFEATLLPLLPLVRTRSQRGMYWRFVNWWATERDAKAHLDADKGQVTRASSIRTPTDQIANHLTIEFQLNMGKTGARRTLTDQAEKVLPWYQHPDHLADDRIIGSPALARSQSVYKIRQAPLLRSAFVWSETTAAAILQYLAVRDSFPRRPVLYQGRSQQLRKLRRGDIVTVTDSAVHLSRAVALVESVRLSSYELCTVALTLLDPRRLG